GRTSFGRHGPQNVGEIFRSELRRRRELVELRVDVDVAFLPLDRRISGCQRRKRCPREVDLRITFTWPIVDRRGRMADDSDSEERGGTLLRRRTELLRRVWRRLCERGPGEKETAGRNQRCCTSLIHGCEPLSAIGATSGPPRRRGLLRSISDNLGRCSRVCTCYKVPSITFFDHAFPNGALLKYVGAASRRPRRSPMKSPLGLRAAVLLVLAASAAPTSAQQAAPRTAGGCPLDPVKFHECAL